MGTSLSQIHINVLSYWGCISTWQNPQIIYFVSSTSWSSSGLSILVSQSECPSEGARPTSIASVIPSRDIENLQMWSSGMDENLYSGLAISNSYDHLVRRMSVRWSLTKFAALYIANVWKINIIVIVQCNHDDIHHHYQCTVRYDRDYHSCTMRLNDDCGTTGWKVCNRYSWSHPVVKFFHPVFKFSIKNLSLLLGKAPQKKLELFRTFS